MDHRLTQPEPVAERPAAPARVALRFAMLTIIALSAWAAWTARGYGLWQVTEPGPGLFPLVAALVAGSVAIAILFAGQGTNEEPVQHGGSDRAATRRLVVYAAVVLLWPLALPAAGYLASSAIALIALLRLAEGLTWPRTVAFTAVTLAASWLLFEHLLGVGLPKGLLVLRISASVV